MQSYNTIHLYITNIPLDYHACHLRNFFHQYVEAGCFSCFHFRHRPEVPIGSIQSSLCGLLTALKRKERNRSKRCAILSMPRELASDFTRQYDQAHWLNTDENETPLAEQCGICTLLCSSETKENEALSKLIEFKPPIEMPQGNVGTPTSHFFKLIKACQLDSSIISKLRLEFNNRANNRLYGEVSYAYGQNENDVLMPSDHRKLFRIPHDLKSQRGSRILNHEDYMDHILSKKDTFGNTNELTQDENSSSSQTCEDDLPEAALEDPCEEWERFEALHDDPYKIERRDKANLKYEDKIELVWEKGGSGLLFHTDERTWRKLDPLRKEELFDEPASFDWDVDMEPYEVPSDLSVGPTPTGHWGMARDTTDMIHIQRVRENLDHSSKNDRLPEHSQRQEQSGGQTSGFHLLRRIGWQPGMRLGGSRSSAGLLTPIEPSAPDEKPKRTGLGYYGPRRQQVPRPIPERTVYIRTAFDSTDLAPSLTNSLLRRVDPHEVIKYRIAPQRTSSGCSLKTVPDCTKSSVPPTHRTVILNAHTHVSREGIAFVPGGHFFPTSTSKPT